MDSVENFVVSSGVLSGEVVLQDENIIPIAHTSANKTFVFIE